MSMHFGDRLFDAVKELGVPLAMGLDPHLDRFPASLRASFECKEGEEYFEAAAEAVVEFNAMAIEAARGKVAAIKPQFAFYEQLGSSGMAALEATCAMAKEEGILLVADAKRGDISSTGAAYARAILSDKGPLAADSVTLNPWMGVDTLTPFLQYCETEHKGIFALLRTTNPGAAVLQLHGEPGASVRLASALQELSHSTMGESGFSSVGAVVGGTVSDAAAFRALLPAAWFLVPGMGAQGASPAQALSGARADGMGALVVCSRSILYPKDKDSLFETNPQRFIAQQLHAHAKLLVR